MHKMSIFISKIYIKNIYLYVFIAFKAVFIVENMQNVC